MTRSGTYLITTFAAGGNVPPLVALCRRMIEHGHNVRVLAEPSLRARFEAERIDFHAHRTRDEWIGGAFDWRTVTHEQYIACLRGLVDDVLAETKRAPTDALVVDFMQPETLCAAEATGLPWAAYVHTMYRQAIRDMSPMNFMTREEHINIIRAGLALPKTARVPDLLDRATRIIATTTPAFDAAPTVAPNVRYVGPIVEDAGPDAGWAPPWPDDAPIATPMILVGMGSTEMGEAPIIQRILDALVEMPVRVLVTVGDHLDPASFSTPKNAVVSPYVRHAALMPHARAFIAHCGLSGIGAALAHGVPIVCIPLGRDQPANAERVAALGAGIQLTPEFTSDELRNAVTTILNDPPYAAAANRMAADIATYGNGIRAVEVLEELL